MPFETPDDPAPAIAGDAGWWYPAAQGRQPSDPPPDIILRGAGPETFQLVRGFGYRHRSDEPIQVTRHDLDVSYDGPNNSTDFASVPSLFWWLIASYGHHTRAALIHDQLWEDKPNRTQANLIFRDALAESGVPFLRRWIMWSGVDAGRRWDVDALRRGFLIAEALLGLAFFVSFGFWAQPWVWHFLGWLWGRVETVFGWPWRELEPLREHWPSLFELGSGWLPVAIFALGFVLWRKRWLLATLGLGLVLPPLVPEIVARLSLLVLELPFYPGHRYFKDKVAPIPSPAPTLQPLRKPPRL